MGLKLVTRKEELTGTEFSSWKRYEALPPFHCTVEFAKSIKDIDPENNQEYIGLKEFAQSSAFALADENDVKLSNAEIIKECPLHRNK